MKAEKTSFNILRRPVETPMVTSRDISPKEATPYKCNFNESLYFPRKTVLKNK